jgi:hypothetical protein
MHNCFAPPAAGVDTHTADTAPRPFPRTPAAPLSAVYQSTAGNTFVLNTTMLNFTEASRSCNMYGWHLATFDSRNEQNEVEAFFTSSSYLLPTFHRQFWMGLIKRDGSSWSFMDPSINTNYTNYNKPSTSNLCGAAFYANRVGSPSAWGWGDNSCASTSVFVCRNTGELAGALQGHGHSSCVGRTACTVPCNQNVVVSAAFTRHCDAIAC